MTLHILSQSESQPTTIDTLTSMDESQSVRCRGELLTSGAILIVYRDVHASESPARAEEDFYDLDAAVDDMAQQPELMAEARKWAGEVLYGCESRALRALRLARGMSQGDFAAAMGTNQATVSRWENGKTDMRSSTMRRIAHVLSVPLDTVCFAVCASAELEECDDA